MIGFGIDKIQADYVAEIKLRHLNREYILKKTEDIEKLRAEIEDMEDILASRSRVKKYRKRSFRMSLKITISRVVRK